MTQRVHLVLGASGGIGAELVQALIARGDAVLAFGRDAERLAGLPAGDHVRTMTGDARDAAAVTEAVAAATAFAAARGAAFAGAACLVGSIVLKPAHSTAPEELMEVLGLNLVTAFNLVRAAAPALGRAGGGAIVLMSSAAASFGLAHHEAIAAAKAGVEGLTRSAAATYAPRGVRVNAVAPGLVRTPLSARITGTPASLAASEAMHPLGRIGEAQEVAHAIAWLLGPEGSWITGQTIGVDGGLARVASSPRAAQGRHRSS
ncbi:MAG: SDR family oxidoreductase [Planctomycetota bacterium]